MTGLGLAAQLFVDLPGEGFGFGLQGRVTTLEGGLQAFPSVPQRGGSFRLIVEPAFRKDRYGGEKRFGNPNQKCFL